jgi:aminoglycoside phosphotransferase (APT) family kinase protein
MQTSLTLPLEFAGEGWDNVMVRLGEDLVLRLPRRSVADQLLRNEQRWLPELAPLLPRPVPVPLRTGRPQDEYPYAWSVLHWIEGETADLTPPDASEAPILAHFLKALHQLAPDEAPDSDVRGCPLSNKREDTERRMAVLAAETDAITPAIRRAWEAGAGGVDRPAASLGGGRRARTERPCTEREVRRFHRLGRSLCR